MTAEIDWARSVSLCRVGCHDYYAAVCITPSGDETLWLVAKVERDDYENGIADQPHERLGRLPHHVRERIWGDALRCGQPRSNGEPCRTRVAQPGGTCHLHADGSVYR